MGASPVAALPARRAWRARPITEHGLVAAAAAGDSAAIAAIYDRHHATIYRYVLALVRDPEDARDVLQTTFLNALGALAATRPSKLRPWLLAIARNEAITLLRRRRYHHELDEAALPAARDLDEQIADRARLAELFADLQDLPERQRSALLLRELCALNYEEIGVALGLRAPAARQAVYEARVGLQERASGRSLDCDSVGRLLADADGRALRGVRLRAHLRACDTCRELNSAMGDRRRALRLLFPPLPVAFATAIRGSVAAGGGGAGAGGLAAGGAAGIGSGLLGATGLAKYAIAALLTLTATLGIEELRPADAPRTPSGAPPPAPAPSAGVLRHPDHARTQARRDVSGGAEPARRGRTDAADRMPVAATRGAGRPAAPPSTAPDAGRPESRQPAGERPVDTIRPADTGAGRPVSGGGETTTGRPADHAGSGGDPGPSDPGPTAQLPQVPGIDDPPAPPQPPEPPQTNDPSAHTSPGLPVVEVGPEVALPVAPEGGVPPVPSSLPSVPGVGRPATSLPVPP